MDVSTRILSRPEQVWEEYLGTVGPEGLTAMEMGKLMVTLRIETDRRVFALAVGNSLLSLSKEEIISAMGQTLKNSGMYELTLLWYERLLDWQASRTLRFSSGQLASEQHESASSEPASGELSSVRAALDRVASQQPDTSE